MSNEEIKLRFFALYLGQPIIQKYNTETVSLMGVAQHSDGYSCFFSEHQWGDLGSCQLVLKPLSEISDEDAIAAASLFEPFEYKIQWQIGLRDSDGVRVDGRDEDSGEYVVSFFSDIGEVIYLGYNTSPYCGNQFEIADFLRSKGYCLPYMGFDPFKEGWAIPAESHKTASENQEIAA